MCVKIIRTQKLKINKISIFKVLNENFLFLENLKKKNFCISNFFIFILIPSEIIFRNT